MSLIAALMYPSTGAWAQSDFVGHTVTPSFVSIRGEAVSEIRSGSPVLLDLKIHNHRPEARSDVIIFEIRDADVGITHYLGWQTFSVEADGDYAMAVSWLPTEPGEYVLRGFVIHGDPLRGGESMSVVHESELLIVRSDAQKRGQ